MVAQTDGVLNFTIIMTTSSGVLTSDMILQAIDQNNATDMPSTPSGSTADSQAMQYIIPLCIFIVLCLLAVMVITFMINSLLAYLSLLSLSLIIRANHTKDGLGFSGIPGIFKDALILCIKIIFIPM